jgi:transketolase
MRNQLVDHLVQLAHTDQRIVLLTADLGFGVVERFQQEHPSRFFNVGVAEQGMIAVATGLAHRGFTPYCYSIATFATLRGLEFIRNGPVAHQLPVRIIGVGPGFDYENDGITHYAIDDIAVMRIQSGMSIWTPSHPREIQSGLETAQGLSGPVYIRVPRKAPTATATPLDRNFEAKSKVCVLSLGDSVLEGNSLVSKILSLGCKTVDHFSVGWIDASFEAIIGSVLSCYPIVVCVENHLVRGGFGSAVLEVGARLGTPMPRVLLSGIESLPIGRLGNRSFLNGRFSSDPNMIAQQVIEHISRI